MNGLSLSSFGGGGGRVLRTSTPSNLTFVSLLVILGVLQQLPMCMLAEPGKMIHCRCNTWDCEERYTSICSTTYQCFVQVEHIEDSPDPVITFGCLSRHSIMCQNPRPDNFDGDWPIMHCCSSNYCNKDVLPTRPPQWKQEDSLVGNTQLPSNSTKFTTETPAPTSQEEYQPLINPIFIAVPLIGALIVTGLIILAVYWLRRQPQPDYKYHSTLTKDPTLPTHIQQHGQPPKHFHRGHLDSHHHPGCNKDILESRNSCHNGLLPQQQQQQQQQQHISKLSQPGHNGFIQQNGARNGPVATVEPFAHRAPVHQPYPDGERSSSGSESKLLMRNC